MGTGKGKTRRLHASTFPPVPQTWPPDPEWHDKAWDAWVKETGAGQVSLAQYYLGDEEAVRIERGEISYEEAVFIVREVFTDAISCEAIELPQGAVAADFNIIIDNYMTLSNKGVLEGDLLVEHMGFGKTGGNAYFYLDANDSILNGGKRVINQLCVAITDSKYFE